MYADSRDSSLVACRRLIVKGEVDKTSCFIEVVHDSWYERLIFGNNIIAKGNMALLQHRLSQRIGSLN